MAGPGKGRGLRISVVVTATSTEDSGIAALRECLSRQSLGEGAFELLVPDLAGSPSPVAAWDRAAAAARAPLLLWLGDDERPRPDLLERHLEAHRREGTPVLVQGLSRAVAEARAVPVDDGGSGLPLSEGAAALPCGLGSLLHGRLYGFRAATSSNLSLPRAAFARAGGLDALAFADGVGAAWDLGLRAAALGLKVRFREDAASTAAVPFDLDRFLASRRDQGRALARLARKHDDASLLWFASRGLDDDGLVHEVQHRLEAGWPPAARILESLRRLDLERAAPDERARVAPHLETLGQLAELHGFLLARLSGDPLPAIEAGPAPGRLTSVVVLSHNALAMTRLCLERLRRHREAAHPVELIVVDNGSADGSREWLCAQGDVQAICNPTNLGAPLARNQALARARGTYVAFLDNDALVGPGWLGRLLYHAEADPEAGFVGPVSDRAAHGQTVAGVPADPAAAEAFAAEHAARHRREFRGNVLMSSFCILARRSLLERLGGFDPRFSPWGFEDDDITLRAHLAGLHNRVALDVLVQHLPYAGPKLERHQDLLRRNWRRFAAKWGLGADAPYGGGLELLAGVGRRCWSDAELFVAPDAAEPDESGALRPAAQGEGSPRPIRRRAAGRGRAAPPAERPPGSPPARLPGPPEPAPAGLELSVIVPTFGRPDLVASLLGCLDRQTVAAHAFELVLVDDGSPEPLVVDPARHAYRIECLRQDNAGPGAARNWAIGRCRAPLTLILNDDAVPAPDDLAAHLRAHRERPGHAVLGTFDFVERARAHPFVRLLEGTSLLFNYAAMKHGGTYPWPFFWTCNLSLETEALRAAGGFDAGRFHEAVAEDVELGYRLGQRGLRVLHDERARCGHDHVLTPGSYFRRMVRLGVNLTRMFHKHGDPAILWRPAGFELDDRELRAMQARAERRLDEVDGLVARLEGLAGSGAGRDIPADELRRLREQVRDLGTVCMEAGILLETTGTDLRALLADGPPRGALTSVVVTPAASVEATARCLEALERHRDPSFPTEVIVHAPGADALGVAGGEWLALVDGSAMVTAGWLERLLYHGAVDARVGLVGALATGGRPGQEGGRGAAPPARSYRYQRLLAGHLLLARRALVARLGGLDPALAGSDLQAADLALRAHLLGWRNRVALDVCVESAAGLPPAAEAWDRLCRRWGAAGLRRGDFRGLVAHVEEREWSEAELQPPQAPRRLRVSLCVIARDEEHTLGSCLASAAPWVDEIVVVDTGSRDRTVEVAREHGARVVRFPWCDDFAAARNRALEEAGGEWVLSLDADERLAAGSGERLRRRVETAGQALVAFEVRIDNRSDGDGVEQVFRSHACRLFPRHPRVRWVRPVHEQVTHLDDPGLLKRVASDDVVLEHDGYLEAVWRSRDKGTRNARLLGRAIATAPGDGSNWYFLGQEHYRRRDYAAALKCFERALELGRKQLPLAEHLAYAFALATGACLETGELVQGIALGEEGARHFEYPDLLCNLGFVLLAAGEAERAEGSFARALALAGRPSRLAGEAAATTWRPREGLGFTALSRGDARAALDCFEAALAEASGRPRLRVGAARACLALGRIAEARRYLEGAVECRPEHEQANLGLVECAIAEGDAQGAYERLEKLVAADPGRIAYRVALGDLLVAASEPEAALTALAGGMESEPRSSLLYLKLGSVLARLERREEAFHAFTVAAAIDPGNVTARQAAEAAAQALAAGAAAGQAAS